MGETILGGPMSTALLQDKETIKKILLEILTDEAPVGEARFPSHKEAILPWKTTMATGTFDGRPFSSCTVEYYSYYVEQYFECFSELRYDYFETVMSEIPIEQFGKRDKYYRGILCFAKYLVRENSLPESFLKKAKMIKPKRHCPPKQASITEDQLELLLKACRTPYETLIIRLLSSTGLRASEFCALKRKDINLEEGFLTVQNGKWGKRRKVGLNDQVLLLLKQHIDTYQLQEAEDFLFLDAKFQPLVRDGLLTRLYAIGKRAGVHVSPHMLRRAFVTINANKGRSLVMLQMACGHADITTTRSYCQTTEDEVINAMKSWG
jgi:integrase